MRGIRKVLTHRSQSFEAALKTTGTVEFWKETLTQKKQDERGSWLEALEDDNDEENVCPLHFSSSLISVLNDHARGERCG